MKRYLLLLLSASLYSPITANTEGYSSILKKTKDTVNKIEIRNQEQCDMEADMFSQSSGMRREICEHDN